MSGDGIGAERRERGGYATGKRFPSRGKDTLVGRATVPGYARLKLR